MADYQARINLLVTGQNRLRDVQTQLQQIEQTITDLERRQRVAGAAAGRSRTLARAIGGTEQPRGPGGQLAADPNRQQRFAILAAQRRGDVEERLSRILGTRARAEADSINTRIAGQNRVNKRIEAQITLESRLNAAVDLYRTNLQKFERAGGTTNVALNRQVTTIRDAFAAFEAGGSRNLRLVRSLATELGRVGEAQREINRTQSLGSKGFEAGRRLQERLTVVGQAGVTNSAKIRRARSLATQTIAASRTGDQQAYQEALRRATAATARLERESLATARALKEASAGYATSPIRGTPTMPGSPAFLAARAQRRSAVRGRIGGVLSGAAIGGAFPLLFGQSGGAALGGAVGGLAGGLLGPGGSFAGSLLGTLLGDVVQQGGKIKELAADIGFSADQTTRLQNAFALAGQEADKFQAAVQNIRGLGLSLDDQADAIALAANLTEAYSGKIDKIAAAYANFVEKGKVGISDITKFTSEGIPILDELEKKYNTNRDGILKLAKDGKISAQDLSDALINIGNSSDTAVKKTVTGWNKAWVDIKAGVSLLVQAVGAYFNVVTGSASSSTASIAESFGAMYKNIVQNSIDATAALARNLANLARFAANLSATVELGGLNIGATASKNIAKTIETNARNFDAALQKIDLPTPGKVGPITVPGQAPATGTGGGGKDRAKKERESQLADILAANGLFRSQETVAARIAIAEVDQNKAEVARLQHIERSVQLLHEAAAITRSNVPLDEKQAQLRGVQDKLVASTNQYEREIATEKIAQAKAATEQLQKMQDEQELLRGRLAGNEAEVMLNQQIRDLKKEFPSLDEAAIKTTLQQTEALKKQVEAAEQMKQIYTDIGMTIKDGVVGAIQGAIDGTKSLQQTAADLLNSIADQLLNIAVNLALFGVTSGTGTGGGLLGFLFKNANGNVYAQSGIQPFAKGGIVNQPTLFPFAKGIGLMGEAGPEAIMPLTRGPGGQLGVSNFGGGGGGGDVNVVVNVDAKGTSVEGNEDEGKQLGRLISAAVQSELIKQQRPGGLLAR